MLRRYAMVARIGKLPAVVPSFYAALHGITHSTVLLHSHAIIALAVDQASQCHTPGGWQRSRRW
jgi:hypothetical protein